MSAQVEGVLDLTFLEILTENDFIKHLQEKLSPKETEDLTATTSTSTSPNNTASQTQKKKKKSAINKDSIKAIRLGNNNINDLSILYNISNYINPENILWFDLSFNSIEKIPIEFLTLFPNLTTIYLHANSISNLSEIKNLSNLANLRSLSLYGNPVEEKKHYRNFVLFYCKKLTQFDKSPITKDQQIKVSHY